MTRMKAANMEKKGTIEVPSGWGWRHTVVVVTAVGNLLGYFLRVDMSVAIVAMVDQGKPCVAKLLRKIRGCCGPSLCGRRGNLSYPRILQRNEEVIGDHRLHFPTAPRYILVVIK